MKDFEIVYYGNPLLRKKGQRIEKFDAELQAYVKDMLEFMYANDGIGLASQQIGQVKQIAVVDISATDAVEEVFLDGKILPLSLVMPLVIVNPEIEFLGKEKTTEDEGCLSFPLVYGPVTRPYAIKVKYQDEFGNPHELKCEGMLARCIQHETDHLNGIVFIDRMEKHIVKELEDVLNEIKSKQGT